MLIECPSCHARAQLPESKAGARVRCGECGRVYVAASRAGGRRTRVTGPNMGLLGGLAAGIVVLMVVLFVVNRTGDDAAAAHVSTGSAGKARPKAPPQAPTTTAPLGWDSPAVQAAAELHEAVQAADTGRIESLLHGPRLWAADERAALGEDVDPEGWRILPLGQRREHVARWTERLRADELITGWTAFDGEVLHLDQAAGEARVRLTLSPAEGGMAQRFVDWRLARDRGDWKGYAWERWLSPQETVKEEKRVQEAKDAAAVQQVTLADGTEVVEREPEPLEHLETTPPDLRKRVDRLYATLIDLDLTTESAAAKRELAEIGKPAIPVLLTGLYEARLDSEQDAIRVNIIVQTLKHITGNSFGYRPRPGEEGSLAEERRQSAVRQWFAWWYQNKKYFTEKQVEDLLQEHIQLSESDRKWLERHKD